MAAKKAKAKAKAKSKVKAKAKTKSKVVAKAAVKSAASKVVAPKAPKAPKANGNGEPVAWAATAIKSILIDRPDTKSSEILAKLQKVAKTPDEVPSERTIQTTRAAFRHSVGLLNKRGLLKGGIPLSEVVLRAPLLA